VPRFTPGDTGPAPPLTFDWRVMLFDAAGEVLILQRGTDPRDVELAVKLPIQVGTQTVGFLGYVPRLQFVQSLESITARRQSRHFGVIGIGMLAAVLLNDALIANWLARRLRALGQGAASLARGDYGTRMPVRGHDELARLAGDFNHLAEALAAAQLGRQQWIADIAHELRTPLTTLRAELEAVQDGVRPLTQDSIASVAQEVHRLTRLVEDLRLLSLSDLGALTYRKERVNLADELGEQLAISRAAIDDAGLVTTSFFTVCLTCINNVIISTHRQCFPFI
jgi:two-component system sensor histidine kinase BaeS